MLAKDSSMFVNTHSLAGILGKIPSLLFGLFLFALGVVMNINAGLGVGPWTVLAVGLSDILPWSLGQVNQLIGLIVIIVGWLLGFPPGLATVFNMYFIGFFIDVLFQYNIVPAPTSMVPQLLLLLLGIAVIGVASFFYLRVQLGAGPRDGLMVGMVKKLDRPVSHVRGAIEVTVLLAGWMLGGPVGLGTLISALTIGVSVQQAFKMGGFNAKEAEHMDFTELHRHLFQRPIEEQRR